ncbi:DMT family transporter [Vibrio salinus]|uniref:DMT family transporter n=1 Tax=Vibrio salinus TaxID=2899784 RepID=UPI001E2D7160|nr:EamA family transporter [Vibrio salinus]MCE0495689.1 EamA family transporter [Vibrio salinus]
MSERRKAKGVWSVIVASIFWGTTGTVASLIPDVNSLAVGAFAMGFGGLLLLFNAQNQLKADWRILFTQRSICFVGGLSVAVYPLAFYTAMKYSGVAVGTLISISSAPLFSVLLECLFSKKRISTQWICSFFIGIIGIFLLTAGKQKSAVIDSYEELQYLGIFLAVIAGGTYALYSWAARQMIEKGASSKSAMAGMFGLAALLLLPSLIFTGENVFSDKIHVTVLLYMAIVPMFLGYLCFGYALKRINASQATLITLLEPAIATLLAVYFVGEKFAPIGWCGLLLIIVSLVFQMIKLPASGKRQPTIS